MRVLVVAASLAFAACAQTSAPVSSVRCAPVAVETAPAGNPPPAHPPVPDAPPKISPEAFREYFDPVRKRLLGKWQPPLGNRRVSVQLAVQADGCVPAVVLSDRPKKGDVAAVQRAFDRLLPLPPPPELVGIGLEAGFEQHD